MAGRSQLPVQIMENQTRFDLNAAVENWRSELAAQPNLASDDRRELETHLRDAIAGFQQRGLNDEESFWLARKRVGQPQPLGEEFVKADPAKVWRERIFWMVSFVFLLGIIERFSTLVVGLFPKIAVSVARGLISDLILIIAVIALLWLGKIIQSSKLMRLIASRVRFAFVALALILTWSAINYHLHILSYAKLTQMGVSAALYPIWQPVIFNSLNLLILAALIVWLMPPQNRKTPKRA